MKKTLTTCEIAHELLQDSNANWSRAGAFALAEWLQNYEAETEEELEFDIVAIRCDFSEFESAQEAAENYGWKPSEEPSPMKFLENRTSVIEFDCGIIIQLF